jgi:tape measure domain-containing protein
MADAQIRITADTSQAERALGNLTSTLKGLAAITIGAGVIASLGKVAIEAQEITNKLLSVSDSLDEANGKFYLVGQTAMKTGSSIGGTADLYQKLAMSATFAGSSTESLLKITENFNKTLQISGASGAGAAAALYQFAQAAQKGSLNGDEFRTMAETNGYMLQLLSKELKISQTELRQMASDGKLSMEVIGKALYNSKQLADDYGKAIKTIPQAMENLRTSTMMTVKAFDDFTGLSNAAVVAINLLADNLPAVVAAVTGLAAAFLLINFGTIIAGIRMLTVAMVGLAASMGPIGLAVTAIAGIAAYVGMGKAIDDAKKKTEQLNKANEAGLVINKQRTQAALDLDKALTKSIQTVNATAAIDFKSTGMKSIQLEQEKAINLERIKYLATGDTMSKLQEQELAASVKNKILGEEHASTQRMLVGLKSDYVVNSILDVDQAKIAADLEKFRLSVSKETFALKKGEVEQQLLLNQAKEMETKYARATAPASQSQVMDIAAQQLGNKEVGLNKTQQDALAANKLNLERGNILEREYADQEIAINKAKTDAILANEQQAAENRLKIAGVTNQAIIDAVKTQMAQVKMIQQGGIVGAQGVLGAMGTVFQAMGAQSKKAFEAHKAVATAQALISTYQAAAMAIAFPPGPPISLIYVAGAIAAGMAQIAQIRSQQYSGRALGGPVMGNKPYIVGENGPELFTPSTTGSITRNDQLGGGGETTINFNIQANDAAGFDSLLTERRGMITQFVRDAMMEQGQRSRM